MYFFLVTALPGVTEKGQEVSPVGGYAGDTRSNAQTCSVKSGPWGQILRSRFKPWLGPVSAVRPWKALSFQLMAKS